MRITTRILRRLGACRADTRRFGEMLPGGVEAEDITPALVRKLMDEDIDVEWFCEELIGWEELYDATHEAWQAWRSAPLITDEVNDKRDDALAPIFARLIRDTLTGPEAHANLARFGEDR